MLYSFSVSFQNRHQNWGFWSCCQGHGNRLFRDFFGLLFHSCKDQFLSLYLLVNYIVTRVAKRPHFWSDVVCIMCGSDKKDNLIILDQKCLHVKLPLQQLCIYNISELMNVIWSLLDYRYCGFLKHRGFVRENLKLLTMSKVKTKGTESLFQNVPEHKPK